MVLILSNDLACLHAEILRDFLQNFPLSLCCYAILRWQKKNNGFSFFWHTLLLCFGDRAMRRSLLIERRKAMYAICKAERFFKDMTGCCKGTMRKWEQGVSRTWAESRKWKITELGSWSWFTWNPFGFAGAYHFRFYHFRVWETGALYSCVGWNKQETVEQLWVFSGRHLKEDQDCLSDVALKY